MSAPELAKLQRPPAYKLVYQAIEREIFAGRLRVGDRLPAENTLAQQLGVNRSTVREGIRLLEQTGLVEREGGKRPRIALPHYMDLASRASRALVLHSVSFRELWEASVLIEPMTAVLAAQRRSDEHIERLTTNLQDMAAAIEKHERGVGDDSDFVKLDIEFHEILSEAADNRVLQLAREPIRNLFLSAGRLILPRLRTHRRVLDAHRALFEAVQSQQPEKVREWMTRHIEDFKRGYERTGLNMDDAIDKLQSRF